MRSEDRCIIQRCLDGEPEAFGFIIDKYKESIYAFAYTRLRNFHDAEDVAQEVFIKAFRKLNTLKSYDNLPAWLYAITSNTCKDWLRSRAKRPDQEFIEDKDTETLDADSINSYRESMIMDLLHDAIDSLPEIYREVLVLYYLGNMSSFEIANFTGIAPGSVRQRLTRARDMLKKEMLEMMTATFEGQKLKAGFTFRIVESVKNIKINPVSTMKGLPWGLSFATGIVIAILGFGQHIQINLSDIMGGLPLPSETKVLEVGEIPYSAVKISMIPFIASKQGDGRGIAPDLKGQENAFFMAPQGEGGRWVKKADMPTVRFALSTSVVDKKIYAIGGAGKEKAFATVEEYDPTKDLWIEKTDMLTSRAGLSTNVVNGRIYAIGGWRPDIYLSTVEEYNPLTDTWIKKTDMPTARFALTTCVVNGRIYAIGGYNANNSSLPTLEEYDPLADKWEKKADMPTGRDYLSASVVDGKIYVIGGEVLGGQFALSTVEEYDPTTDIWTKKADMPTPRVSFSTSAVNGKIYAIGGGNGNDNISIVEEYDPIADIWTKKSNIPTVRTYFSTSVVNGKIYAIGGWGLNGWLSLVEEYTPEGWSFALSPQGKLPSTWGQQKGK